MEILFDLLYWENKTQLNYQIEGNFRQDALQRPRFLINREKIIKKVEKNWYNWSHPGLKKLYSVSQAREVHLSFCLLFPVPYSPFPVPSSKQMSVPHQYGNCYILTLV